MLTALTAMIVPTIAANITGVVANVVGSSTSGPPLIAVNAPNGTVNITGNMTCNVVLVPVNGPLGTALVVTSGANGAANVAG